jgi:hypothetical protein
VRSLASGAVRQLIQALTASAASLAKVR